MPGPGQSCLQASNEVAFRVLLKMGLFMRPQVTVSAPIVAENSRKPTSTMLGGGARDLSV